MLKLSVWQFPILARAQALPGLCEKYQITLLVCHLPSHMAGNLWQGWTVSSVWWKKNGKNMEKPGLEEIVSSGQKWKKLEETTFCWRKLFLAGEKPRSFNSLL